MKDLIASMTLEEKAYFVTGTGMRMPDATGTFDTDAETSPGTPAIGETARLVPGAAGTTYEIARLGIRAMVLADGPAGLRINPARENDGRSYYCTAFPVATQLASTWDTGLVYRVGQAMGSEALEYGVDILLAPGMNLHRNPLCGRNFEYYSEDPRVTGLMAAAMVKGVESTGVGTSIKHFAANNAETNRNALDTVVSERALRELYLEGFRIAVEGAQPWTVMSAYNLINGTHTSESHDLLTKVLRDDWGFRGFVMTDWFGGIDPVAQVEAGNDLLMPGTIDQAKAIISAVEEGRLDERVLDRNIERILQVLVRSPRFRGYAYSNEPDLKAHAEVARQAASEGMVLLKNSDRTLPLAPAARLALFGNASYATVIGGTGSGKVNEAYSVSPAEGLTAAGYAVDESLRGSYRGHIEAEKSKLPPPRPFAPQVVIEEMAVGPAPAARAAASADAAIITIGRNSGEGRDRNIDGDFNLTRAEKELIEQVARAFHAGGKKVVVVLNIGGVIETASWRDIPDAMLLVWQGGQEAGNAIADVLSGRVNPSGKLATTFPVSYPDVPSAKNFPGTVIETAREPNGDEAADQEDLMAVFRKPKASRVVYEEGIYVGYRYHETFGVKPAYEFGYGLSYTNFDYSGLRLSSGQFSESLTVAVVVRNTGDRAGREVAQLYIGAPAVKLDKPAAELKGFAKTRLLQPGESELLEFTLLPRDLSSFDAALSSWIAEAGDYEIRIGASSRDIRRTAVFSLKRELMVKKESVALRPVRPINEMKP